MPAQSPSNGFIDTLRFGATLIVAQLTIYQYSNAGSIVSQQGLPCSGCNITVDRNSAIRRSGSLTVELIPSTPPPPLLPTAPPTAAKPQPLAPFGNEIGISLGLAVGNQAPTQLGFLTGGIGAGSIGAQIAVPNGGSLGFTIGDTIVIGSAAPVIVTGITGTGPYLVYFLQTPLSSSQPPDAAVQHVQFVSLGLFTVTTTTVDSTANNLVVTLDVSDRSFVLDARELTAPYTFPATESGTYEDEVVALLTQAWGTNPNLPPLQFSFSDIQNPIVPTATYNQGTSPWQMALDLAQVAGNELYVDMNGVVTSHQYPNPVTTPVTWFFTDQDSQIFSNPNKTIISGSPYTVPVGVEVAFTRDGIHNDVYITGSGSQNAPGVSTSSSTATGVVVSTSTSSSSPVLGHAADQNPTSATYIGSVLGDLPNFTSSNLVPTASQAQAMASLDLAMSISSAWQITVTAPPNPLFDVDDVVSVNHPSIGIVGPNGQGLCMIVDTISTGVRYDEVTTVTGRVIPGRYA